MRANAYNVGQTAKMPYQALKHFDAVLIQRMNSLVGRSVAFDKAIALLLDNPLVTALLLGVFWAYWFRPADATAVQKVREHLLATLWAGIAGIVIARILALELPFRTRPRFNPSSHFPVGDSPNKPILMDWSAFPSDHAVMYAALAVGLCFVSLRVGLLATLYVAITICLPRAYFGYHYPSDLLLGFVIGAVCAWAFNLAGSRRWLVAPILPWEQIAPRTFYVSLYFLSFQFATMFDSLRGMAAITYHFAAKILTHD
jgi:undecaprenyl-diphosphatase